MKQKFNNLREADPTSPNFGKPLYIEVPMKQWIENKVEGQIFKVEKVLANFVRYLRKRRVKRTG